jgi:IS5 family transposase
MEKALIEMPTMSRFAGIDLISDLIPDEPEPRLSTHIAD